MCALMPMLLESYFLNKLCAEDTTVYRNSNQTMGFLLRIGHQLLFDFAYAKNIIIKLQLTLAVAKEHFSHAFWF